MNNLGQLGDGAATRRIVPTAIGCATDWNSVRAGYQSTCALKARGELWCWGANNVGQLSDSTTTDHWTPVQVR